jgi:hypothetical protein
MRLEQAYARAAEVIRRHTEEGLAVAKAVERLRTAWRPKQVRVVLLAESHVWTGENEITSSVRQPDGSSTAFARFVYCLGYGEPQLVDPRVVPNSGTPHYWRLFHDAIRGPDVPLNTGGPDSQRRVQNKWALLHELRAAGIWLVDASVIALYRQGERLANGAGYREVLKACWTSYVGEVVAECSPSAVLIVGKAVDDAIGECVRRQSPAIDVETVNQPNARLSGVDIARDRRLCFDFCRRHQLAPSGLSRRDTLASPANEVAQHQAPESLLVPDGRKESKTNTVSVRSTLRAVSVVCSPRRYAATCLTFKAAVIEPLEDTDEFEVETPEGIYHFTKREFYQVFHNVVNSDSYKLKGVYHYSRGTSPQKARRFIVV